MRFKESVDITGIHPEMMVALYVSDQVYKELGKELVVTSVVDGQHSFASLHYAGYALDLRTRYFDDNGKEAYSMIRDRLGNIDFDVVHESNHIHIEYQPKR